MFDNIRINASVAPNAVNVNVMWRWRYERGMPLPECTVFCCSVPEVQLLRNSIFTKDEIISWVNKNMIDLSNPDTRVGNIEAFWNSPANKNCCRLHKYSLANGANILANQNLQFPLSDTNKVFIVCVFGIRTFEIMVVAANPPGFVPYEVVLPGWLDSLRGKKDKILKFSDAGDKKRVLITELDGMPVYSVLPDGAEFNIENDGTDNRRIGDVVYLSSLIGN